MMTMLKYLLIKLVVPPWGERPIAHKRRESNARGS